jgi:membrane-bound serine protease (ClpP class)
MLIIQKSVNVFIMKNYLIYCFLISCSFFSSLFCNQNNDAWIKETFSNSLEKHIFFDKEKKNNIGYLHIGNEKQINQSTFIYMKLATNEFIKKGVSFVVLDLNTPGGEVFSAQKISKLLIDLDEKHNIPTICYINNWAISAGAMIAYSCRYIGSCNSGSMGAAEPILMGASQPMVASEKMVSALRSEFSNLASIYNRDPLIAEAMVDKDIFLVLRNKKITKISAEKDLKKDDEIIIEKGKLLTLNANNLQKFKIADFRINKLSNDKLAVLTLPFFKKFSNSNIISFDSWKIKLFTLLSNKIVMSVLVMGLMLGFYTEISMPGFGIFGSLSVLCLSLILLSNFAIYTINWVELIIFIIGIILLMLELLVIPGFGIVGIVGILLSLFGLFSLAIPSVSSIKFSFDNGTFNLAFFDSISHMMYMSISVLVSLFFMYLISRYFIQRSSFFKKLIHEEELLSKEEIFKKDPSLIGMDGVCYSSMKPFGKVLINDIVYQASSVRGFVKKDQKIKVVDVKENGLVVKSI